MKIEIWSDVGCPYCYIGLIRLENAIKKFEHKQFVEILPRSFELEPDIPVDGKETQHQAVMRKYRQNAGGAQDILDQAGIAARETGITINWNQVITTNSFDAHRLIHFAGKYGKALELKKRLFSAYFTEGKHIGNRETLISLGKDVGLDGTTEAWEEHFSNGVRKDEQDARYLNIRSVPHMLIDEKFAMTGARSEVDFLEILQDLYCQSPHPETGELPQQPGCEDGTCSVQGL